MTRLTLLCRERGVRPLETEEITPIVVNGFDENATNDFIKKFTMLQHNSEVTVIPIIINSYGGDVYELEAMIALIDSSNKPVATIGIGKAMSCGAALLAAGTEGYRFSAPNSDIMIHEVSTGARGKMSDVKNDTLYTQKLNDRLMKRLAKDCGQKLNYFIDRLKKNKNVDLYLTAKEAKKIGLIDHIGIPTLYER